MGWWKAMLLIAVIAGTSAVAADKKAPAKPVEDDEPKPEATEQWEPLPLIVSAPAGAAPSDAIALFAGKDLNAWEPKEGEKIEWKIVDGALVVEPGTGNIQTKQSFGNVQLHLEFRTPSPG